MSRFAVSSQNVQRHINENSSMEFVEALVPECIAAAYV